MRYRLSVLLCAWAVVWAGQPGAGQPGERTVVKEHVRLQHVDASEIAGMFWRLTESGTQTAASATWAAAVFLPGELLPPVAYPQDNSLIVTGTPEEIESFRNILTLLDIPEAAPGAPPWTPGAKLNPAKRGVVETVPPFRWELLVGKIRLRHALASDVAAVFDGVTFREPDEPPSMPGGLAIIGVLPGEMLWPTAWPPDNSLINVGTAQEWDEFAALVRELDVPAARPARQPKMDSERARRKRRPKVHIIWPKRNALVDRGLAVAIAYSSKVAPVREVRVFIDDAPAGVGSFQGDRRGGLWALGYETHKLSEGEHLLIVHVYDRLGGDGQAMQRFTVRHAEAPSH